VTDNPFEPKTWGLLAALGVGPPHNSLLSSIAAPTPKPAAGLLDLIAPNNPFVIGGGLNAGFGSGLDPSFGALFAPAPPKPTINALTGLVAPSAIPQTNALHVPAQRPKPVEPETKRRAFFSFKFDDIMRVNNVRNAWKIAHADSASNRSFYDSSLWESRKITNADVVKQLIRSGVLHTSAVCVLTGTNTWKSRWVRYEIARAIIDGRGLLTVHLNGINHHQTKSTHPHGRNPLAHMGVARLQPDKRLPPQYYLCEMEFVSDRYGGVVKNWTRYSDYQPSVKKPAWLSDPPIDHVMPLSAETAEYDYVLEHGHRNIGSWIDAAAKQAGR
jgi:hypothetical protein